MIIKNISNQSQSICGLGEYLPGKEYEVSEIICNRILRNSNFIQVDEVIEDTETTTKKKK